ncbi:MAG TPA: hypothetical protein VEF35_01760 [Candidatus Bathyarchaeia archaeon]|nr:hypothetical protein [Candidatus Bathyarchaeia archaeon]
MDPPLCPLNNDRTEVDELVLEIADYKNDYADTAAEKLFRKCSTVGWLFSICETARTMLGYRIANVSSCDDSSRRYRCRYMSVADTGGHMSIHKRIKTWPTLAS